MNKVILLGRLTRDPEVRYTQSDEPLAVCRFGIAVDRPYRRNANANDPTADFFNCTMFGKRGETISQYFRKGNKICVSGRLQNNEWTDNQGNRRINTDIIVDDFDFVESKSERSASGAAPVQSPSQSPAGSNDGFYTVDNGANDEDLPF